MRWEYKKLYVQHIFYFLAYLNAPPAPLYSTPLIFLFALSLSLSLHWVYCQTIFHELMHRIIITISLL